MRRCRQAFVSCGRTPRCAMCTGSLLWQTPRRQSRSVSAPWSASDAVEDFSAARPDHAAVRADRGRGPSGDDRRRGDETPAPDRGDAAIRRPRPRGLEADPWAANASGHIVGDDWARCRRIAEEHAAEIADPGIAGENLQQRAALAAPGDASRTWCSAALPRIQGLGSDQLNKLLQRSRLRTIEGVLSWHWPHR